MSSETDKLAFDSVVNNQVVHVYPVKDDVARERAFVQEVSPNNKHLAMLQQVAGAASRNIAFIALAEDSHGEEKVVGSARYAIDEYGHCDSVITIASEWVKGELGQVLMKSLIEFARHDGKEFIYINTNIDDKHTRLLARNLNLSGQRDPGDATMIRYELSLR